MPEDMVPKATGPGAAALAAARNLQQRVTSGVIMALVAMALVYIGHSPFALLVIAVALVMSWEWGHLVRGTSTDQAFGVHAVSVAIAIALGASGYAGIGVCILLAGAAVILPLTVGQRSGMSAIGVGYVGLAAVALVWLRREPDHGLAAVVFLFLIVWSTDIMAFAVGRTVGGIKLWPQISPNKTWSGFVGGVTSSGLLSALYASLVPGATSMRLCLIGLALGIVAQAGDLAESALKRAFGVKDASALIPGHGGVMDRMDGIVTVAMAAALMALIWNPQAPASALLIGH